MSGSLPSSRGSCQSWPPCGVLLGARLRVLELRVPGVGDVVRGAELGEARDGLDAGGDEGVALAGLDRVERHPRGLHRGGAVAGDRGAGDLVVPEQRGHDAAHVVAGLAAGEAAAEDQVVDRRRVQLRDLVQRGLDDQRAQVVGTEVLERSLVRAADGGAGRGNDHCLGHGCSCSSDGDAWRCMGIASLGHVLRGEPVFILASRDVPAERICRVRHTYECPVRWADMDMLGHVNNVTYVDYLAGGPRRPRSPGSRRGRAGPGGRATRSSSSRRSCSAGARSWSTPGSPRSRPARSPGPRGLRRHRGRRRRRTVYLRASTLLAPSSSPPSAPSVGRGRRLAPDARAGGRTRRRRRRPGGDVLPAHGASCRRRRVRAREQRHVLRVLPGGPDPLPDAPAHPGQEWTRRRRRADRHRLPAHRCRTGRRRTPCTPGSATWAARSFTIQAELLDGEQVLARAAVVMVTLRHRDPAAERHGRGPPRPVARRARLGDQLSRRRRLWSSSSVFTMNCAACVT